MDSKRVIGGFCAFCGGLIVNIIQGTHPDWFGNHTWILPASFVILVVGLLVWICQYSWTQKLLGIASAPQALPTKNPDRVELQKLRDDLAESANRNLECRSKLAELQDAHTEEKRKLEITHNAELSRAKEFYRQCEEEKRAALRRLEEAKAPRVYLRLIEPGDVPNHPMQTRLVLENRGETEGHNVEVEEVQLRIGKVTFGDHPIGVIHPTKKEEVETRCNAFGPAFMMNIIYALKKEFGTYNDQLNHETLSIPMVVTYFDFQEQKFETRCDLVFYAIRDAMKPNFFKDQPSVEFQNFHIRKVSA